MTTLNTAGKPLMRVGNCELDQINDRYVMTNTNTGVKHDLSARPDITSPARLEAHWKGFVHYQLDGLRLGQFSYEDLQHAVRKAKRDALKECGDFCDDCYRVLMINGNDERIGGGPVGEHDGKPSITLIEKYFRDYPEAHQMCIENQTRWYGEGNAFERLHTGKPADWWVVNIYR